MMFLYSALGKEIVSASQALHITLRCDRDQVLTAGGLEHSTAEL